ncbi:MAG: hypothetical protein L0Z50_09955, partial [Verrucomicrobiales bacterium]|nr:hypothetical protein [Verrucomicrobiales bacterium]
DFDLGPANGGNYYFYAYFNDSGPNMATAIDRTKDWHHFEIRSWPDELKLTLDDQLVHSGPKGIAFDKILFDLHGPRSHLLSAYFDDFSFQAYTPTAVRDNASTSWLMTLAMGLLLAIHLSFVPSKAT